MLFVMLHIFYMSVKHYDYINAIFLLHFHITASHIRLDTWDAISSSRV